MTRKRQSNVMVGEIGLAGIVYEDDRSATAHEERIGGSSRLRRDAVSGIGRPYKGKGSEGRDRNGSWLRRRLHLVVRQTRLA